MTLTAVRALTLTRLALRAFLLAFMSTTSAPLPAALPSLPAATPADRPASPPQLPDAAHVPLGCFISTTAYLSRFATEHPTEFGAPLTVSLGIVRRHHTFAVLAWRGEWWVRDEFLGVIRLHLPATVRAVTESVARRAKSAIARKAARVSSEVRARVAGVSQPGRSGLDAAREVKLAAALLPLPSEAFIVTDGDTEIPLLFFRPGLREVAVYDPHYGTATAETDTLNHAAIVESVARRLGYRVTSVRRDPDRLLAGTIALP